MSPGSVRWPAARAYELLCARTLIGELVRVRDLGHDLVDEIRRGDDHSRARASASDLVSKLADTALFCREHATELGRLQDLSSEIGLVQQVQNAIASAMTGPFTVTVTPAIDYDLVLVQSAASQLSRALDDVRVHAVRRLQTYAGAPMLAPFQPPQEEGLEQQEQAPSARIAPSAGRLLMAASRLLPPSDRVRYAEEYESELWELASAGASRAEQLRYAKRQALRAAQVRGEVLAPRSKSAAP